ncbi:phospholipase [Duganella sp. Leaf126]|uniref:phospholipase D-like domain-containing protein n=1 Tax=Duganella sp. Leaf126 TaxID=1736266 RepID=UPI0006FBF6D8|nr:phospholipase D-like domain-containing protein [Duganella sp. Leaf126]KQQ47198.1 phospholipase [Duganella sp. Leaf126]
MRRIVLSVLVPALLATAIVSPSARAEFSIPGFELVQTAPAETVLRNPDLRDPVAVWSELFDSASKEIVIGQFYAVTKPGSAFEKVFERLAAAGARGVKIRFLLDQKGVGLSEAATIERLKAIPNLELRLLDFSKLTGNGIIHAKYLVVDGKQAFIGSQNFDWRSFEHIHETGVRITDAAIVGEVLAVFNQDWRAQGVLAKGGKVPELNKKVVAADYCQQAYLLASPNKYNTRGIGDSETGLPKLLADAKTEVRVQLLDYAPLSYGPNGTRPYYAVIDNALRAAANRGVKVRLMVSNWNLEMPAQAYLKSLAVLPNVEVRVVTLPMASSGFIPFARVIHSKTMVIDNQIAWVGTSNWAGGYMDLSRNFEVVMRNEKMAERLAATQEQIWTSPYAQPLNITKQYPKPVKGQAE